MPGKKAFFFLPARAARAPGFLLFKLKNEKLPTSLWQKCYVLLYDPDVLNPNSLILAQESLSVEMPPRGRRPAVVLPVNGVPQVRDDYYELRSCRRWFLAGVEYNYDLYKVGLQTPAIQWFAAGSRGYARAMLAGGGRVYLQRLMAYVRHKRRRPNSVATFCANYEAHHKDLNRFNNRYQNLAWWSFRRHREYHY
jgi:hypothetical protein